MPTPEASQPNRNQIFLEKKDNVLKLRREFWASVKLNKHTPELKLTYDTQVIDLIGRGERIRTSDHLHPMQVRYQAALRPEEIIISEGMALMTVRL